MEETRQHPIVGREKRLFLALVVLGLLAPLVGLALQLGYGGHFLLAGVLSFGLSRVATEVWQFLRPESTGHRRNKLTSIFSIVVWIILVSLALFYVSSIA